MDVCCRKGDVDAAIGVLTQCSLALARSLHSQTDTDHVTPLAAESHILLAQWLPRREPLKNVEALKELANIDAVDVDDPCALISRLMERASQLFPQSAASWLAWGQFQFDRAQQLADSTGIHPVPFVSNRPLTFMMGKLNAPVVRSLLDDLLCTEELNRLIDCIDDLKDNALDVVSRQPVLSKKPQVMKRILAELEQRRLEAAEGCVHAVECFFNYLHLRDANSQVSRLDTARVTLNVLKILTVNPLEI